MATNTYSFQAHWTAEGTCDDAFEALQDPLSYPQWWPAVWLKAEEISPGDGRGIGQTVRYITKGWLPYLIHWTATTVVKERPHRLKIEASGDFVGQGCWTFQQEGDIVKADYLWELHAEKLLLRYLSPIFKPLFAWNHRWAMKRGEESFRLEIKRNQEVHAGRTITLPEPPGPVFWLGRPRFLR
jgi:hypothetical protein